MPPKPTSRPVTLVLIAVFFFSLILGSVNYAMIFYLKDLFGADKSLIGLASAGQTLVLVLTMLFLMGRKVPPFRTMVLLAMGWAPICIATYLIFPFLGVVIAFHGLFGLSGAFFWPRVGAWLSHGREGKDLGRIMGRFNLAWSTGGLVAPTLGGVLLGLNLRFPFYLAVLVTAVLFTLLLFFLGKESQSQESGASAEVTAVARKTPLRIPGRLGMVSVCFLLGTLVNIYPAYARDTFHHSEALIGTFLMARMATNILGFFLWSRATFWHFQPWVCPAVQVGVVGIALLFPLAGSPLSLWVLFGLMGMVYSIQYTYSQFHSTAGTTDRSRGTTIHEVTLNVGYILGTAVGGWVGETFGMAMAFGSAAALALGIGIAQALFLGPRLAGGKAVCLAEVGQGNSSVTDPRS